MVSHKRSTNQQGASDMNYKKAKRVLQYALDHQDRISISKLKKLMEDMNITLESSEGKELDYLKSEIKKMKYAIYENKRLRNENRKLKKERDAACENLN